jgi:uncharacterized membrane protein YeaQ/YmgE (transglycosylase-associated protein family)
MTTFEIVSSILLGLGAGFASTFFARQRTFGLIATLALGAVGGFFGAAIGQETVNGPTWGSMGYHPLDGVGAVIGGVFAVVLARVLIGARTQGPTKPRPDPTSIP